MRGDNHDLRARQEAVYRKFNPSMSPEERDLWRTEYYQLKAECERRRQMAAEADLADEDDDGDRMPLWIRLVAAVALILGGAFVILMLLYGVMIARELIHAD